MRKPIFFFIVFTFCFAHSFVSGQNNPQSQNNSNDSQSEQPKTNQNVTITEPVKVLLEPDTEQIESEKGYKARQEQRDETNALWNRAGVIINSLLFILVLIQAYFSLRALNQMQRQASTMEKQAETMQGQLKIAEKQSGTMIWQAKTMKGQLDVMEEQSRAMSEQVETMREQSEKMNNQLSIMQDQTKLMEETLEETRKTIEENNRTFKIGNRAYVNVCKAYLSDEIGLGKTVEAVIEMVNKGNTPAWVERVVCQPALADANLSEIRKPEKKASSSASVLRDGTFNAGAIIGPVDKEEMQAFESGESWIYVFGAIEYKDLFDEWHTTNFCLYQKYGDGTRLNIYRIGNESD
jgi:hypothetical protein